MRRRFKRYQDGEKLADFFHALMETRDGTPHMLEWGEIAAELNIMLNAGSVSTAISINNTLYLLLKNPHCLKKLREEIDLVADKDEVAIAYEKVKYLPYLRACVDEAMRVLPPTTFGFPRKTPEEGCTILGEFVPGKTSVSMSSYVSHRDEKTFSDSERYLPERWVGEEGKHLQPYFIAFSAGARGALVETFPTGSNLS